MKTTRAALMIATSLFYVAAPDALSHPSESDRSSIAAKAAKSHTFGGLTTMKPSASRTPVKVQSTVSVKSNALKSGLLTETKSDVLTGQTANTHVLTSEGHVKAVKWGKPIRAKAAKKIGESRDVEGFIKGQTHELPGYDTQF